MTSKINMKSIDYNLWMTIIKLLSDKMPNIMKEYGVSCKLEVKPSYPRDLASMNKPSIIIRKVDTGQSKVGMGNFLGQVYDNELGYQDVNGIMHNTLLQFDVVSNSNTQATMLASMLTEEIFNETLISDGGRLQLYDFTHDINNPTKMGVIKMEDTPSITNIPDGITRPNANNDYITAVRQEFNIIQAITPIQDYIDLSKWIHQSFIIKTN